MKDFLGFLKLVLAVGSVGVVFYLLFVAMYCTPGDFVSILPHCVNIFHPLLALSVGCAVLCIVMTEIKIEY